MLKNRLVVITGGSRGFGKVLAKELIDSGARVVITGRNEVALEQVTLELGNNAYYCTFDISDPDSVSAAFSYINKAHGEIDTLINNAGVLGPVDFFWKTDIRVWCEAIDINLKGTALCSYYALQNMIRNKNGKIINIVSNAGVFRWPTCSSYSTSKAAIIKFTENLAAETKKNNVLVYAYHPGLIHSDGMSVNEMTPPPEKGSTREKAFQWFVSERDAGNTVDARTGARPLVALINDGFNILSGRYFTVFDNLESIKENRINIKRNDLMTLRLKL